MCSKQLGEVGVLDPLKHVVVDHSNDREKYSLHLISQAMTLVRFLLPM